MDIITKTGEIWSENAIGAVISLIKESDDSIEAERKLTHWLTEMNCQLIAMALARIDTELYQMCTSCIGCASRSKKALSLPIKGPSFRLTDRTAGEVRRSRIGGGERSEPISRMPIVPYDIESQSRNADFISIARKGNPPPFEPFEPYEPSHRRCVQVRYHNPRPERPSNLRTLGPERASQS